MKKQQEFLQLTVEHHSYLTILWSLHLLADKAVELELVETISPSKVRQLLKKMNLRRLCTKRGVSVS